MSLLFEVFRRITSTSLICHSERSEESGISALYPSAVGGVQSAVGTPTTLWKCMRLLVVWLVSFIVGPDGIPTTAWGQTFVKIEFGTGVSYKYELEPK